MAKRKRLIVPGAVAAPVAASGAQSMDQTAMTPENTSSGALRASQVASGSAARAPIADVARDAASTAALQQVSQELTAAKSEGRMVQALPFAHVTTSHLIRDRMVLDAEDMEALKSSLRARGQQAPIEVTKIAHGQYGLISGYRRLQALKDLYAENPDGAADTVLALVRQPEQASDAYIAMVEENEIRAGLSYYERASIVRAAVKEHVFPSETAALQGLFAAASRSKRSKIKSFLQVIDHLGGVLQFPTALSERVGLALGARCAQDAGFATRLKDRLRKAAPETPAAENALLAKALEDRSDHGADADVASPKKTKPARVPWAESPRKDVHMVWKNGQLQITGDGVTQALAETIAKHLRNT